MTQHSFLQKLLQGQAVEWRALGEVCELKRGQTITAKTKKDGNIPVISGGQQPAYYNAEFNREGETITVAGSGAYAGHLLFWNEPIYVSDAFSVKPDLNILNTKYVFHFLLNNQNWIYNLKKGSGVPHVYPKDLAKLQIPIPPLSVQSQIVQILDTFTELTAELTAELSMRQKQYQYYRNKLLTFDFEAVQSLATASDSERQRMALVWKTLGEVSREFGRGKSKHRPRNDERLYGGDIPFIQTGDIRGSAKKIKTYNQTYSDFGLAQSKLWKKDTLCITIAANIAETAILDFDACFPDSIIGFVADPKQVDVNYIYYLLQSLKTKLQSYSTGSAQENLNLAAFEDLLFPIPPLSEQARIVTILDTFDTLVNSISNGLPKEIKLRQQQYEYYRERLLGF